MAGLKNWLLGMAIVLGISILGELGYWLTASPKSSITAKKVSAPKATKPKDMPLTAVSLRGFPLPQWERLWKFKKVAQKKPIKTNKQCGWSIPLSSLHRFSDKRLATLGWPLSSPIVVVEDGQEISGFGGTKALGEDGCMGVSDFTNKAVFFSPKKRSAQSWQAGFSSKFPLQTPKGLAYWIYENSRAVAHFSHTEPWRGMEVKLLIQAQFIATVQSKELIVQIGKQQQKLGEIGGVIRGYVDFYIPDEKWSVIVQSPRKGPYVILDKLELHVGKEKKNLLLVQP